MNSAKRHLGKILNYFSPLVNAANVIREVIHSFPTQIAFIFLTVLLNNASFGAFMAQNPCIVSNERRGLLAL